MKCAFCQGKKGKRVCQRVARQSICTECCGAHRSEACAGCSYYGDSERYQQDKRLRAGLTFPGALPELEAQCDAALMLVEAGEIARARARFEELDAAHPDYPMVAYGLGACHGQEGRTKEAIACFERAIARHPGFAAAHYNLGLAHLKAGWPVQAVGAFEAAVAAAGTSSEVATLARARLDDFERAVVKYTPMKSLSAFMNVQRLFERGAAALNAGRAHEAIEAFLAVLARDDSSVQTHGNLGLAYGAVGDKPRALAQLDAALALDPNYELATVNRHLIAQMTDGEPIAPPGDVINYYGEFQLAGRSYLQDVRVELASDAGDKT